MRSGCKDMFQFIDSVISYSQFLFNILMYYPPQTVSGPIMQPSRYPINHNTVAQQNLFQGYAQPSIVNSQKPMSQGYPQQVVGHYPMQNEIGNPSLQRTGNNIQVQSQGKVINYGAQHPLQQSFNSKPPPLMQPPSLTSNIDQGRTSQFFQQRAPMTQSNNEEQQQQQQMWTNEAQIASIFWQQRCMTMLQRFEWFYERFQILRNQYSTLSEEMQKMDSEEEWHRFQTHHDQFHEKIEEMEQELSAVLGENQQLVQQKQTQQNENVWQQRYQQLLGNFKSLQEEMVNMESSGVKVGEVTQEQYQQLQEHCGELQYQYGQVVEQLQKYRQAEESGVGNLQEQVQHYMNEIEQYKNKLNVLHDQNVELQGMYTQAEQQNQLLKRERTKSMGIDRNKYEELVRKVELKQQEIQRLQQEFKGKGTLLDNLNQAESALAQRSKQLEQIKRDHQQINREADQRSRELQYKRRQSEQRNKDLDMRAREVQQRNRQIEDLRRQLRGKEGQLAAVITQSKSQLSTVEQSVRSRLKEQHQAQKRVRDKKIIQLQRHLEELQSDVRRNSEYSFKADNLEKKLNYVTQENTNLSENLKKKSQELVELRSLTYEFDKLKQMQGEYYKTVEERDTLKEAVKKKQHEIDVLRQENDKLSVKMQDANNKRVQFNIRNLTQEIEDLNERLNRKEGEVSKLKSLVEVKEEYSLKMEEQVRQAKSTIIILEQSLENERESIREKEMQSSCKSNDYEKRIKNLDYEFNIQLKDTLQKEVIALRRQNVQKQQQIRRLEQKEEVLTSKLAIFQKQKENFDQDVAFLKKKERELQLVNEEQGKKLKEWERTYKDKEEDLQGLRQGQTSLNTYVNNLKLQIEEHNTLIKSKNRTIEQLQASITARLSKNEQADRLSGQNGKLKAALNSAYQQIENLRCSDQQLSKSKALSTSNLHSSRKEFQRQQNIVIGNLHQENQQLKQQIAKLVQNFTDTSMFPQKDSGKKVTANLNKRLTQFHSKLQYTISPKEGGLHQSESQKILQLWEKQRRELVQNYESELKSLKEQLAHIKGGNSRTSDQLISQGSKRNLYQGEKLNDEAFYKQRCKQQQERNAVLIKVNEELKAKIESILKIKQTNSPLEYYKQQCERIEGENDGLKQKVKALGLENKQFKIQLAAKNAKITQEFQFKFMELQMVIQQNERKIAYLQSEKVVADNEKATLAHDLNIVNLDKSVSKLKPIKRVQSFKREQSSLLFDSRYPQSPKYGSKYGGVQQQFSSVLGNIPSASYVPSSYYNHDKQSSSKKYLERYGGNERNKAGRV